MCSVFLFLRLHFRLLLCKLSMLLGRNFLEEKEMMTEKQRRQASRQMQEYGDRGGCAPAMPRYDGPNDGPTFTMTFALVTDQNGGKSYRPIYGDAAADESTQYFDREKYDREVAKYNKAIARIIAAIARQQERDCLASLMVVQRLEYVLEKFRQYVGDIRILDM